MNGLLICSGSSNTKNIGDYIQTVAQEQFWENVDCFIEREALNSIESKDKDFIIIDIRIKKLKHTYKISIIDNGKGMSNEVLNHIEDTFYSTKQTGTGIGMSYVKKIIELHKGKITYKSKEKEGTTVNVNLPLID